MKLKALNTALTAVILSAICLFNVANAGLIQSDYMTFGDNLAVYDEDSNLTWLDLSLTVNLSYNGALAAHDAFQHATQSQIYMLFNDFKGTTFRANNRRDGSSGRHSPTFNHLFGATDNNSGSSYGYFLYDNGKWGNAGVDYETQSMYESVVYGDRSGITNGSSTNGTYLVRPGRTVLVDLNPVDVPEPSTFAIFVLGLMGLSSRRFKK